MKKKKEKNIVLRYTLLVIYSAITAILLRSFVIAAYKIPTSSMENTLLKGDFIMVNKIPFGGSSPSYIPFTNIKIPTFEMPWFNEPEKGDVVIFKRPYGIKSTKNDYFVKRCVGLPGDVVFIKNKVVYVNERAEEKIFSLKLDYGESFFKGTKQEGIFPSDKNWNEDYYGPVKVPEKNMAIKLTPENIFIYKDLINYELNSDDAVSVTKNKIFIGGKETEYYSIKNNYYFVLGDNRNQSADSRFWGFVPEKNLIGKAMFIYWSMDPKVEINSVKSFFKSIRWNRILRVIK